MKGRYILVYPLLIAGFGIYLMMSDTGVLEFSRWSEKNDSLRTVLDSVKTANKNLEQAIDSVRNKVPFKMEQIAREKYSMKKPNEKLIIVKPEE